MKSLYTSRTFWLAVTQAIVGTIAVFATSYPGVGTIIVLKSLFDIVLRVETTAAITPVAYITPTDTNLG